MRLKERIEAFKLEIKRTHLQTKEYRKVQERLD